MTDYNKYNTNIVLEVAMKDPEVPGAKHPGYFQAIPSDQLPRNINQEIENANMHNFGIDVENLQKYEDMIFNAGTGGAPMAIGSIAKGGKGLLSELLKKLKGGKNKNMRPIEDAQEGWEKYMDDYYSGEGGVLDFDMHFSRNKPYVPSSQGTPLQEVIKKAFSKTPGVKSSKDVFEAGRLDILDDAYTGGRFSRGATSTTGAVPGGRTPKVTSNIPANPLTPINKLNFQYKNLANEYGVNFNKLKKMADKDIKQGFNPEDAYYWALEQLFDLK